MSSLNSGNTAVDPWQTRHLSDLSKDHVKVNQCVPTSYIASYDMLEQIVSFVSRLL